MRKFALLIVVGLIGCRTAASRAQEERAAAEAREKERLDDERIAKAKAEFAERDREREAAQAAKAAMQADAAGWETDGGRVMSVGKVFPRAAECPGSVGGMVLLKIRNCGYEIGELTPHIVCDYYGYEKLESLVNLPKKQQCAQLASIAALQPSMLAPR